MSTLTKNATLAYSVGGVQRKLWNGIFIVKISDTPGLGEWLYGQTLPLVEDDPEPTNWCYYDDYFRYVMKLPIVD